MKIPVGRNWILLRHFLFIQVMENIKVTQRGNLIGIFCDYTVSDYITKNGIKCKLFEIPTGENCFVGYNDFHYVIEKVFKCDGCGNYKPIKEKFSAYDENYNVQKGIYECANCKGL